jgi:hypothetical protein
MPQAEIEAVGEHDERAKIGSPSESVICCRSALGEIESAFAKTTSAGARISARIAWICASYTMPYCRLGFLSSR